MHNIGLGTLFGIALIAVAVVITTWSVEPTVGKTPTVSLDPLVMTGTVTNLLPKFTTTTVSFFPKSNNNQGSTSTNRKGHRSPGSPYALVAFYPSGDRGILDTVVS